jgi:hypothetical protein
MGVPEQIEAMQIIITRRIVIDVATPDPSRSLMALPGETFRIAVQEFTQTVCDYTIYRGWRPESKHITLAIWEHAEDERLDRQPVAEIMRSL